MDVAHAYARHAAYYVCAAEKIGKYEQVSDALFRTQQNWASSGKVEEMACSVLSAADASKVRKLAKDPAVIAAVDADMALGQKQNVNQTPTMVIVHNGQRTMVPGPIAYPISKRYLDMLLAIRS